MRRPLRSALSLLLALAGAAGAAATASGQDTAQVKVIRPEARPADSSVATLLPPGVLAEVLAAWNDSGTTRITGNFLLPAGARLSGAVAVFRGSLRVSGALAGPVTVINGDLLVDAGASVSGPVLVVGGRIDVRPGGRLDGPNRAYARQALLYRTATGALALRPPARPLGDLASARASFTAAHFRTDLTLETGRTYNRVEGLPLLLGPTVVREGLPNIDARADLHGIVWTAPDQTKRRASFGYTGGLELRFGAGRRLTVGGRAFRLVTPIEEQPLSGTESGWSALFLQRDLHDYYQAQGTEAYLRYALGHGLVLGASLRYAAETSVPANDPISVFRNDAWRPNPLVDDGHFTTWRAGLDYDTRNEAESPTSGWLIHGWWEESRSGDAAPLTLPAEVRDPIRPGSYRSQRVWLDARRYARLDPAVRAAVRFVAGGWAAGDPLPVQRRMSLGGPDILPGYGFRNFACVPAGLADPAHPAFCDRLIAVQAEVRTRTRVGLPFATTDPYVTALQRLLSIREPDVVVFADGGKAWVTGTGPGRVPNDRLPVLREWAWDFGFGLDAGGLGLYLSQSLNGSGPLTFTVRLQRRF
jgi:hypothetical protein